MAAKLTVDLNYVHQSKKEAVTVQAALEWFAARLGEDSPLVDEEGEADYATLAAQAICKGYLRAKALESDGARVAAKLAPAKVYTARLGDVSKEAATALETAKAEAAKLAGIVLPTPKAKAAPAPARDLEAELAKLMAENAALKASPVKVPALAAPVAIETPKAAPKARKPKAAKAKAPKALTVQTPAEAVLVQAVQALAPKATPAQALAVAQAATPAAAQAIKAEAAKAEAPAPTLASIVEWFKADLSRDTQAARKAFPTISAVKLANCYRAARA